MAPPADLPAMRTVFMGTPEIAVPALEVLSRRSQVICVVTQPDRRAGRGSRLQSPPIKVRALELGLPVWQPERLRLGESGGRLTDAALIVVMAYGAMLRRDLLEHPSQGCINIHASLLPRWRGASPLQAALRAGDARTGVSVMTMVEALDAGPVHLAIEIPLGSDTTLPALHDEVAVVAARALERYLDHPTTAAQATPQDPAGVTICRKLVEADGHLDFTKGADELERWVRAYTPAPGCWAMADAVRWRILGVRPLRDVRTLVPGEAVAIHGELAIGCGDGAIAITHLQLPGGSPQTGSAFLNGHRPPLRLG